ncbi:MAG: Sec-independent protein translocase protein TatB [Lysobacterales bacterium]|jgi:sec-independent protein translocase protein TatB
MFDVGFSELFLLSLIGLLVLGPERLPAVARTIGGFIRKARASWNSLRQTIESELNEGDIMDPIKRASEEFRRTGDELREVPGFKRETHENEQTGETLTDSETEDSAAQDPPQQAESNKTRDD